MVHQVVVCLLSVFVLNAWLKTSCECSLNPYPVMVGNNCNLIDLTIKLNFRHKVDDTPPCEWEPSSLPAGCPLQQVDGCCNSNVSL